MSDEKEMILLIRNFLSRMPEFDKAVKKIVLGYLDIYQKFLAEKKTNLLLMKELENATRYIDKIEDEISIGNTSQ